MKMPNLCFVPAVGPCSEFSFSPNVNLWSYSLVTIDNIHPRLPVLPFQTKETTKQDQVGLNGITSEPALIPDAEIWCSDPWLYMFLFTTSGLCNSDTESHMYLFHLCLHDNSYRDGCLGAKVGTSRRCSKHGSLSFNDFEQTASTPSIVSYSLFMPDLTLKSSFTTSTLEVLPQKELQDEPLQLCILYFNSSTGIASQLQNFTV